MPSKKGLDRQANNKEAIMATVIVEKLAVITDEDEKFVEELEKLCKKYVENDGDYYLSYTVDEGGDTDATQ